MSLRLAKPAVRQALSRVRRRKNGCLPIDTSRCVVVDLRPAAAFARCFVPGSYCIADFAWLSLLRENLPEQRRVYVLAEREARENIKRRFRKHDFDVAGWVHPGVLRGFGVDMRSLGEFEQLTPEGTALRLAAWKTLLFDLRRPGAFRARRVPDALNISIDRLRASVAGLPRETRITLMCDDGEMSCFGASVLRNLSYANVSIVCGGFRAYVESGLPVMQG